MRLSFFPFPNSPCYPYIPLFFRFLVQQSPDVLRFLSCSSGGNRTALTLLDLSCPVLFCSVLTYSNLSWPLLTCPDISRPILTHPDPSWPVLTRPDQSWPNLFWTELSVCLSVCEFRSFLDAYGSKNVFYPKSIHYCKCFWMIFIYLISNLC